MRWGKATCPKGLIMDTVVQAQRKIVALERIEKSALALAPKFDCQSQADALRTATNKDDGLKTLFKLEAIADLLEKMAGEPLVVPPMTLTVGSDTSGQPLVAPVNAKRNYAKS
jgi:hypothetical protein